MSAPGESVTTLKLKINLNSSEAPPKRYNIHVLVFKIGLGSAIHQSNTGRHVHDLDVLGPRCHSCLESSPICYTVDLYFLPYLIKFYTTNTTVVCLVSFRTCAVIE